jgi:dUTP pyrophosphatase
MQVKFSLIEEGAIYPSIAHKGDAGIDLYVNESGYLTAGAQKLFSTGVHVKIPENYFGMVTLRSSLGSKGLIIPNAPGIIDCQYPGTLKIALRNISSYPYQVDKYDRVAQLIILPVPDYEILDENGQPITQIESTRTGGFGSSGK